MVERRGSAGVATFYVEESPVAGGVVALPEAAVRHARVRRLEAGAQVRVTDGAGLAGWGSLRLLGSRRGEVAVDRVEQVPSPIPLTLLVPVADRDRMLWLAEKSAELAITDWRPVVYARSRSVSPRGEGAGFARKVRARMIGALEQSHGAWLPAVGEPSELNAAVAACGAVEERYVLDPSGPGLGSFAPFHAAAIAVGPEGGFEPDEFEALSAHGWRAASLGGTTLRFETAGIAAVAIVRATQGA